MPSRVRNDRLEEHAERETEDGAIADEQAGHRADNHPPRVGEFQSHDPSPAALRPSDPGVWRRSAERVNAVARQPGRSRRIARFRRIPCLPGLNSQPASS